MTTLITESTGTQAVKTGEKPKRNPKARAGARRAHAAPNKAGAAKKAKAAAKALRRPNVGGAARDGSKATKVLELLQRPEGASMKDLMKATAWQAHSIRGFLSGAVRKKMGMTVTSTKEDHGERSYAIKP